VHRIERDLAALRLRREFFRVLHLAFAEARGAQLRRRCFQQFRRRWRAIAIERLHATENRRRRFARELLVHNAAEDEPEVRVVARAGPLATAHLGDDGAESRIDLLDVRDGFSSRGRVGLCRCLCHQYQ
jgi:hypothetical protein